MESSPAPEFSMVQTTLPSVSMDVTEGKPESVHRAADQVMDDGQNRSDTQRTESRPQLGPSADTQVKKTCRLTPTEQ